MVCLALEHVGPCVVLGFSGFGVTLDSLYTEALGYLPVLLDNLCGMSFSGTCCPLGGAWFQCRY